MGCSSNTGDLPGSRHSVLRGNLLFSGRSGRVRVPIRLCRAPYFSLFIAEHPRAATCPSLSCRGNTLCFLTEPFRQLPELQLSCLNKPENATYVFIRWKSVWCALTGGVGDLPLPIMASATSGGVPSTLLHRVTSWEASA